MHWVDGGDTSDLRKPMRSRRVCAQILETAIEARVRLEDAARVSGASGAEQKDGCFFDAEHGGRVWPVECAPDAQCRPLDVAAENAAGDLGEARATAGDSPLPPARCAPPTSLPRVQPPRRRASASGRCFLVFAKIGSVLFGSGYVLLAFLRADLVERLHWLTEAQLLDADRGRPGDARARVHDRDVHRLRARRARGRRWSRPSASSCRRSSSWPSARPSSRACGVAVGGRRSRRRERRLAGADGGGYVAPRPRRDRRRATA